MPEGKPSPVVGATQRQRHGVRRCPRRRSGRGVPLGGPDPVHGTADRLRRSRGAASRCGPSGVVLRDDVVVVGGLPGRGRARHEDPEGGRRRRRGRAWSGRRETVRAGTDEHGHSGRADEEWHSQRRDATSNRQNSASLARLVGRHRPVLPLPDRFFPGFGGEIQETRSQFNREMSPGFALSGGKCTPSQSVWRVGVRRRPRRRGVERRSGRVAPLLRRRRVSELSL